MLLAVLGGIGFSFAAEQNSTLSRDEQWEQARRYLAEGNPAEAREIFEDLIRRYPQEPDLRLFLGIAFLRLREPQAAESAVRKAISLDPQHAEARTLLGWLYSEIHGNLDSAIKEYSKVIELRPDFPEAYNNLGVALRKQGELAKAIDNFDKAIELRADYSEALSNRGWVHAEQHRWAAARRDFEKALQINPRDDGALYGLSQVLRESRDYAGAQQALSRLISQSPNFVYWLEWGRIGLIRYYWVLLLVAVAFFLNGRYRKTRRQTNGG